MSTPQASEPFAVNHAVDRFRDAVLARAFSRLSAVHRVTGEILDPEARALFSALPVITHATPPEKIVEFGLLPSLPKNLTRVFESPKYNRKRDLFVQTKLALQDDPSKGVGFYDPQGVLGFTHRAKLRSSRGSDFFVDVEGAETPFMFSQGDIFAWNEPIGVPASGGNLSGVDIDYNDPLLRAHICAGLIELADDIANMDFGLPATDIETRQTKIVRALCSRMHMEYAGRGQGYAGPKAASLFLEGQGVCFVQRAVLGAYLQAFTRLLAFEVQMAVGRTLRLGVPHGFLVILLRPSLKRFVCDPAWKEPMTELRVAFFDSGWGHDRCLVGLEGHQEIALRPFEIELPEENQT